MDDFRKRQKQECKNGSRAGGIRTYGCPCCRKFGNLNSFKKWSRRLARKRLRREDLTEAP